MHAFNRVKAFLSSCTVTSLAWQFIIKRMQADAYLICVWGQYMQHVFGRQPRGLQPEVMTMLVYDKSPQQILLGC